MSLELCVLGSGSGGNSTVVRTPWGVFLIDAGFGPKTTALRMGRCGLSPADISAIILTHLDHDHFNPNWMQTILKLGIPIFCAAARKKDLLAMPEVADAEKKLSDKHQLKTKFADLLHTFHDAPFEPLRGVTIHPLHLAHDAEGSHGFEISCDQFRVGFATDLGHVPQILIERFCGVDLLALEANYDVEMERTSDRPFFLKQRIMGGKGHLSNEQALAAIRQILDRTLTHCGPDRLPRHIVLLHRSRQCNCPKLLRQLFETDPRISQVLTLTDQEEPTAWLSARAPRAQASEQLALMWN